MGSRPIFRLYIALGARNKNGAVFLCLRRSCIAKGYRNDHLICEHYVLISHNHTQVGMKARCVLFVIYCQLEEIKTRACEYLPKCALLYAHLLELFEEVVRISSHRR